MLENQGENRIASTTWRYHSQSPVSAHRHPTALRHGVRGVLLWSVWVSRMRLIADPGPFRTTDLKGRLPKVQ